MNEMKPISNSRNNMYKVAILLLLAYAAFSSAMKDLNRLQEVAGNVQEITSDGLGGLAKVYSATRSLTEGPQVARGPETGSPESARMEVIAAGGPVELMGLERRTIAKSAIHGAVEFSPNEKQHRDTSVADIRTFRYFTSEISQAGNKIACDKKEQDNFAGKADKADKDVHLNVKNVHLNVLAQMPARVGFVRRGTNIERDFDVATSSPGRTMFRTIIHKIPVRTDGAQWPAVSEFKTLNEVIGLGPASAMSDNAETERLVGEVSDDFSFQLLDKVRRGAVTDEKNEWATHE